MLTSIKPHIIINEQIKKGDAPFSINELFDELSINDASSIVSNLSARATFDRTGQMVAIAANREVNAPQAHLGGNVTIEDGLTTFDVNVCYTTSFVVIHILTRSEYGYKTKGTFAENFRIKHDSYRLTDKSIYSKLNNYGGIGSGSVNIDIDTQKIVDITVTSGDTRSSDSCGIILKEKNNTITLSCVFANGCANLMRLIA